MMRARDLDEVTVREFERTETQLEGFYEEVGSIAKKKPDDAVNLFKLSFINEVLVRANELLTEEYLPFEGFRMFESDSMPTTSDVVVVLAQYLRSMDQMRKGLTVVKHGRYYWPIGPDGIRARAPRHFEK